MDMETLRCSRRFQENNRAWRDLDSPEEIHFVWKINRPESEIRIRNNAETLTFIPVIIRYTYSQS